MTFHRFLLLVLLAWANATAQQPAVVPPAPPAAVPTAVPAPPVSPAPPAAVPAPPGVPVPGAVPQAPAGAPGAKAQAKPLANAAGPQPGIPLAENKIVEDIIEPKLSGSALAGLYRKYTGRRVIVSAAASIAEFSFVQEATLQDPLTYAKASELLRKAATIENFVFVPDEQDANLDILTLASGGIRPTGRGVAVYNENDAMPEGDAVISYVMTLSYIKPAEAVNTFTQIIGQFGAFGSIAAVPNASAVVITENTSLIRKLIDLKKEIDKPSSQVATRFIKVQFADVTELAATLTELLTAQASSQKTAGVQRADAPAAPAPGAPAVNAARAAGQPGGTSSGEETPVQIIPEPRTNRIFAMGRPVDLLFVEGLVREFDVQTSDRIFLKRKLRFLTVSDFLPIASDALTRAFSATTEGSSAGGSKSSAASSQSKTTQSTSRPSSSGSNSRTSGTASNSGSSSFGGSNSFGGSSGSSGMSGGSSGSGGLSAPQVNSAPESVLVGRTLLVADNITNTIVAQGPPSGLEIIERLLEQIDVKPDQVMISTVIGQLTLNDSKEFGMSYLLNGTDFKAGGGGGFPSFKPSTTPISPAFPEFDPSNLISSGLRMYGKAGDLGIFMKALQTNSNFTVLSRPSIFASNNQKGTISSGERIAIPTQGGTSGGTYNSGTSIQYQDVVLKLEVIPLVNSDNEITMQISLLNDEETGTQDISGAGTNGGILTVPRISTREILTTATVLNNETIVLGGLITSKNKEGKSGIPILCNIPYLGKLFSSSTNNKDRTELMIFIQPSIVKNDHSLGKVQTDMDNRYKVSPDVRTFADGPGVLPDVNEIPRVDAKGKNGYSVKQSPPPKAASTSRMKPSIRPSNGR